MTFLDLGSARGASIEVLDDAGDVNRDGYRDVLIDVDRLDVGGGHRRDFFLLYGRKHRRTEALAVALRLHHVRRLKGPNPRLPPHSYRAPSNVGDVNGDRQPDIAELTIAHTETHYACGGDATSCVAEYAAARLVVRSPSGRPAFQFGTDWYPARRGVYEPATNTFGWVGDWNRDKRNDVFEADQSGVSIFALTRRGLRRKRFPLVAAPGSDTPYKPIAIDIDNDGRAEVLGQSFHAGRLSLVIVSRG